MARAALKFGHRVVAIGWPIAWRGVGTFGLMCAIGAMALHVRSYWFLDDLRGRPIKQVTFASTSFAGLIYVNVENDERPHSDIPAEPWTHDESTLARQLPVEWFPQRFEFSYTILDGGCGKGLSYPSTRLCTFLVPIWCFTLCGLTLTSPLFVVPALGYVRRQIRSEFACRECGYDLRGTPERCPECGTAPARTQLRDRLWSKSR